MSSPASSPSLPATSDAKDDGHTAAGVEDDGDVSDGVEDDNRSAGVQPGTMHLRH
jgi:hypothetical protein